MTAWRTAAALLLLVVALRILSGRPALARIFRWFPLPLWCYLVPLFAVTCGWLPAGDPTYARVTTMLLPPGLALLLFGAALGALWRTGGPALIAAGAGAAAIMLGTPLGVWWLRAQLPPEAWKGAGALAGTWTGGTMNLLALRGVLDVPDAVFAPLILVDALMAYGWMALLVAASGWRVPIDAWLRADDRRAETAQHPAADAGAPADWRPLAAGIALAVLVAAGARALAAHLPATRLISRDGVGILLTTTAALGLSFLPPVRRAGAAGEPVGYLCLYLVLAATGAQANLAALAAAPAWLAVGGVTVLLHGAVLLSVGRMRRIPLSVLATASQANLGGVVSAPLVGAVYHRSLAPVGLILAMAGNAAGTYLGLGAAELCRWLTGG